MMWLGLGLCGLLAGITSILFGFGGGFVMVPLLVYSLPLLMHGASASYLHLAIATATLVMCSNAALASWLQWRAGKLVIIPWWLMLWIALGALPGAWWSMQLSSHDLQAVFLLYLALSLGDALWRPGFMTRRESPQRSSFKSGRAQWLVGMVIGCIAAMLGVGGSVMTIPWLRRQGYRMQHATASANALSLPVAIGGGLVYVSQNTTGVAGAPGMLIGTVHVPAAILLSASAGAGMVLALHYLPKVSDTLHARAYLVMLGLVILAMAFV